MTDIKPSRIQRDEKDLQSVSEILKKCWLNLFAEANELVSLSTGTVAPSDIYKDLLHAKEKGEEAYRAFKSNTLVIG